MAPWIPAPCCAATPGPRLTAISSVFARRELRQAAAYGSDRTGPRFCPSFRRGPESNSRVACASVPGLRRDVDLRSEGGVQELANRLETVRDDLDAVRSEASDEFGEQLDTVRSAYEDLQGTVQGQREGDSSLPETAAAAAAFRTAVQNLVEDAARAC